MQPATSSRLSGAVLFSGLVVLLVTVGVALGLVVASGTAVSRRLGAVGGTLLVGLAAMAAVACLKMRPRQRVRLPRRAARSALS